MLELKSVPFDTGHNEEITDIYPLMERLPMYMLWSSIGHMLWAENAEEEDMIDILKKFHSSFNVR